MELGNHAYDSKKIRFTRLGQLAVCFQSLLRFRKITTATIHSCTSMANRYCFLFRSAFFYELSSFATFCQCATACHLLRTLPSESIGRCYEEIIKLLNTDKRDIILKIIKASTSQQVDGILDILKEEQLKSIENNTLLQHSQFSLFDELPKESIINIAAFLDREELTNLKMTNVAMALIVFNIMDCYLLRVWNMTELLYGYHREQQVNIEDRLKCKRVQQFTKYGSLFDIFAKTYHIHSGDLLMFKHKVFSHGAHPRDLLYVVSNSSESNAKVRKNTKPLLILDKRKIFPTTNEVFAKQRKLALLQMFDKEEQQIRNIAFLWLETKTKASHIEQYIASQFAQHLKHLHAKQCPMWCDKLISTLNRVQKLNDGASASLLKLYRCQADFNGLMYSDYDGAARQDDELELEIDEGFRSRYSGWGGARVGGAVYKDEKGTIYDAMLVNERNGVCEKLQVIYVESQQTYFYFSKSHSIDDEDNGALAPSYDEYESSTVQDCIQRFETTFFERTQNLWVERDKFVAHSGSFSYGPRKGSDARIEFEVITFEWAPHIHPPLEFDVNTAVHPFYDSLQAFTRDKAETDNVFISNVDLDFAKQMNVFDQDITWTASYVNIHVSPLTTIRMIQNQISQHFGCKLPAKHIQIYDDGDHSTQKWNSKRKRNSTSSSLWGYSNENRLRMFFGNQQIGDEQHLKWQIVAYDTIGGNLTNPSIYEISVFDPTQTELQTETNQIQIAMTTTRLNVGHNWSSNWALQTVPIAGSSFGFDSNGWAPPFDVSLETLSRFADQGSFQSVGWNFADNTEDAQDIASGFNWTESYHANEEKEDNETTSNPGGYGWSWSDPEQETQDTVNDEEEKNYTGNIQISPSFNQQITSQSTGWAATSETNIKEKFPDLFGFMSQGTSQFYMRYEYAPKSSKTKPNAVESKEDNNVNVDIDEVEDVTSSWSVHPMSHSSSSIMPTIGTRGYRFVPVFERESRRNGKTYYYQNLAVNPSASNVFATKSFEELRFEDQFHKAVAPTNSATASTATSPWNDGGIKDAFVRDDDVVPLNENEVPFGAVGPVSVVRVSHFLDAVMKNLSHAIYGDKYKSVVDKYGDSEKYSFLITPGNCAVTECTKYFENENQFKMFQLFNGFYPMNILIVRNVKDLMREEKAGGMTQFFPLIVQFAMVKENINGYPKKVWINKQTTVKQVAHLFVKQTEEEFRGLIRFSSSVLRESGQEHSLQMDEVINTKINHGNRKTKVLIVYFKRN